MSGTQRSPLACTTCSWGEREPPCLLGGVERRCCLPNWPTAPASCASLTSQPPPHCLPPCRLCELLCRGDDACLSRCQADPVSPAEVCSHSGEYACGAAGGCEQLECTADRYCDLRCFALPRGCACDRAEPTTCAAESVQLAAWQATGFPSLQQCTGWVGEEAVRERRRRRLWQAWRS